MTGANRHLGNGPMTAIVLEGIALLLYWPGTLVETVTFAVIPRSTSFYAAILLSVIIGLGSCAALLAAVRARRHVALGAAAAWDFVAALGLIVSVVVGWGPTDDMNRACYGLIVDPCPGRDGAVALRVAATFFWLLATLTSLGAMTGDIVRSSTTLGSNRQ